MFKKVHKRTGRLMEKRGISMLLNKGVLFLVYTVICQKPNHVHIYTLSYHPGCLSRAVTPGRACPWLSRKMQNADLRAVETQATPRHQSCITGECGGDRIERWAILCMLKTNAIP